MLRGFQESDSAGAGLAGVRVLDFSGDIAGPYCTKLLADAGADVVKVEQPSGDPMRTWSVASAPGSVSESSHGSALFCFLNASKRSVVGEPEDEHVLKLIAVADIVVNDFSPKRFAELDLLGRFPDLVVVSITPYGHTGPLAGAPWTDFTVQAECGSIAFRGRPDQPPLQSGGRVTEYTAGAYAAPAALAALMQARQASSDSQIHPTKTGQHIDLSIAEAGIISQSIFSDVAHQLSGGGPATGPARSVELPSIEPTSDGKWVGFNTNTGQQAENFLVLIERFDLLESGEWTGPAAYGKRAENIDLWNSYVHEWTTRHTQAEIIEKAVELRIPVAPVHNGQTIFEDEHFVARGVFVENPAGFRQPRPPYLMDGLPAPMRSAPKLGEHNQEVTQEWLADLPAGWVAGSPADPASAVPAPTAPAPQDSPPAPPHLDPASAAPAAAPAAPTPVASSAPGPDSLPFSGLRIVDMTSWWAGPAATHFFAMLGAEVIHIESGDHPDGMRMTGAMFQQPEWWEWGHMFMTANTNKLGITLDLDSKEGHQLLCQLISQSHIVVENFSPRVVEKFGLDFGFLRTLNPQVVYMRMPAFGLSGPWRERVGFAQTMEQVAGMAWLTGHVEDQPRIIRGPCDPIAGMHGAFALLVGLVERDRRGEAVFIESTMVEAALNCAAEQIVEFSAYGEVLNRMGNASPYAAPQGLYACLGEEEWLAIAVANDQQWQGLQEALGQPEWSNEDTLRSFAGRKVAHDRLDAHLQSWAAAQECAEAAELLRSHGVPAARCHNTRMVYQHPQFVARGFYEKVSHPVVGEHMLPTLPYHFAGLDRWIKRATPTMGQHNAQVLGDLLGVSAEQLRKLEDEGVTATRPTGV